jgi:eukaryotic-like serine/threonine-protein kinase
VTELTWRDRTGRALGTVGEPAPYLNLALSPEERRVAIAVGAVNLQNIDIWIIDMARNGRSRLTGEPGVHGAPVWSPDGTRIAFQSRRSGKLSLREKRVGGTSPDESLVEGVGNTVAIAPTSWSPNGRYIASTLRAAFPRTSDIWILPLFGDRKPFPLVDSSYFEGEAVFSAGSPTRPTRADRPTCSYSRSPRPAKNSRCPQPEGAPRSGDRMAKSCITSVLTGH